MRLLIKVLYLAVFQIRDLKFERATRIKSNYRE